MTTPIIVGIMDEIVDGGTLGEEVARCWMEVANDGGPVGFPFIPVEISVVRKAVRVLASEVHAGRRVMMGARAGAELCGWVSLELNASPIAQHWGKIQHLQSHPEHRGSGIGGSLLSGMAEHAASLGLEQLVLTARGDEGLESFYEHHGWHEFGRHRGALRLQDNDDRDEVLMAITL